MSVRLGVDMIPVPKSAHETPDMDEIERFGVRPLVLRVVEFEEEIWWRAGGLEGGSDVCGYHFGLGEAFGYCDGPVGGAGADVEDAANGAGDGG